MAVICPTITADNEPEYARQIANVKDFANRIHIDLMDGQLAPSVSLEASKLWLPEGLTSDIHVMFKHPMSVLERLISLKPHMVIIHEEAEVDHHQFASRLKEHNIKAGLALLKDTPLESAKGIIDAFDLLLIFGGHFGYQGGHADLSLLDKLKQARELNPNLEIAWDGGINDQNIKSLSEAGASVLNVGAFIQASPSPKDAYDKLLSSLS